MSLHEDGVRLRHMLDAARQAIDCDAQADNIQALLNRGVDLDTDCP